MRDSFILYTSYQTQIDLLDMVQRGILLTAILAHAAGTAPPEMDGITAMAFAFIREDMDKNAEKYEAMCQKRREAGRMGGRPKKDEKQKVSEKANGLSENQMVSEKSNAFSKKHYEYEYDNDSKDIYPFAEIITYLNEKAGTSFKATSKDTRRHIKARIDEKFTLDDFKKVIDGRVAEWGSDDRMKQYIRPQTLFGTKFESYLNAPQRTSPGAVRKGTSPSANRFNNFTPREYDYEDLERKLLAAQGRANES